MLFLFGKVTPPKVTARGVTSKGYRPRCHLQRLQPEVSPPKVTTRGVTSEGCHPRCHLRGLPPEVSPPRVTVRGVTSKGYHPRCHLPKPTQSEPQPGKDWRLLHIRRLHSPGPGNIHHGSFLQMGNPDNVARQTEPL